MVRGPSFVSLSDYYYAVQDLLVAMRGPFQRSAECLKKTYIMMHSAIGTDSSIQIGAFSGDYSLEMARRYGVKFPIYALEASPRTHAHYKKNSIYEMLGVNYINALISEALSQKKIAVVKKAIK